MNNEIVIRTRCEIPGCKVFDEHVLDEDEAENIQREMLPIGWTKIGMSGVNLPLCAEDEKVLCPGHTKQQVIFLVGKKTRSDKGKPRTVGSSKTPRGGVKSSVLTVSTPPAVGSDTPIVEKDIIRTSGPDIYEAPTPKQKRGGKKLNKFGEAMQGFKGDPFEIGKALDELKGDDPLATLRIDALKNEITLDGVTAHASTLKDTVVKLFEATHGITGDMAPQFIVARLKSWPKSTNRDNLINILTA